MQFAIPEDNSPDVNMFGPPPINLEAEQALLGAMLLRNETYEDIGQLQRHHFFDPLHASMFDAICAILRSGRKATSVELVKLFEKAEPIDGQTTVPEYIFGLVRNVPSLISAKEYARLVFEAAIRRHLIMIGEDIIASAREASIESTAQSLIEEAEERLFSLAETAQPDTGHVLDFGRAAELAWDDIKLAKEGKRNALNTGLIDLDKKMGGLSPSNLIILAGRPSMGKTALATNIAHNVARTGAFVDFYSLEMSGSELANRIISSEARVSSSDLRTGKISPDILGKTELAVRALQGLAMSIDQTGGISIATLSARARRNKRRRNTKLIVVDYLQLMQASRRRNSGNRVEDVAEITTGLKALAKELNVPVIALSQLNRAVESRDNKRPQLSDLRESGAIEQDADVVLFVYRDEYYLDRERPPADSPEFASWQKKVKPAANKAEVIISKQRHGEVGMIELGFNASLTQFHNLSKREGAHGV